ARDGTGAHADLPRAARARDARSRDRAVDRCSATALRPARRDAGAGKLCRLRAVRSGSDLAGGSREVPLEGAQHAVRRLDPARQGPADRVRGKDHARGPGSGARSRRRLGRVSRDALSGSSPETAEPTGMTRPPAMLALEDGRVFTGESYGALAET